MADHKVYDGVLELFALYLQAPQVLAHRLLANDSSVVMTDAGLEFTLPALYDFVVAQLAKSDDHSPPTALANSLQNYASFRGCLYGQQTQVKLRLWGGEVVIATNYQQVDQTIYRLQAFNEGN